MIKKVIQQFKKVFIPRSEFEDEVVVKKEKPQPQSSYIGVAAPVVLSNDPWFGAAPKTEKAMEYVLNKNEELYRRLAEEPKQKEPENIHQVMYERATQSWGSWKEELPGGSENFQEGPGGWNSGAGFQSGTGYNQFRS